MQKAMMRAQKDLEQFKSQVNKTMRGIGTILAATGITLGIRSATKEAMEFEAALQQINRLMGTGAGEFSRWANEQASAFGFARAEAVKYGAVYANLLSGFSNGAAETMTRTMDLLKASAVVASSTGRTMEDVMERIRSGLLGNTEAIEDLGINVNVALIESTKAFRQFANGRSWQQLDFNTQQTIRYFAILEQAATKYGTELAQNTTSRQAAFVAQLKNAQLALGQAFLPIYNAVLPALTRMATALANAAQYLAAFTQALFGSKANQQTKATEQQAGAVSDLGNAYEEAGKQAKGAVAGFDEINLVGGTTPGGGAAVGAGVLAPTNGEVDTSAYSKVTEAMDSVSTKAAEMAAKVRSAFGQLSGFIRDNSAIITSALAGVGAAFVTHFVVTNWTTIIGNVTKAFTALRAALAASWTAALGPIGLVVAAIGAATAAAVYFYQTNETFRGAVDGIFAQIGQAAQWLWEQVLKPFGAWIGSVFANAWDGLSVVIKWVHSNVLVPIGDFFVWLWRNVFVPIAGVLRDVLATAFKFVADIARSFWQNVLVPLGNALSEMLAPAVEAVSAVLTWLWQNVLKPLASYLGTLLKGVLKEFANFFTYMWHDILKPLASFIGGAFKIAFTNTFEAIGGIIDGLKTAFIGLMNFITGVFTGDWRRAWEGIKDIFKGISDGLGSIFKGAINVIIDSVNWLIKQLNKIKIDVPDWLADLTGYKSFGFNIPSIPRLAKGGLAYGPTLAVVGDNRGAAADPEVIAPLSKLETMMDNSKGNREIIAALTRVEQAVRDLRYLQAVISRSEVGRAAIETIKDEQRRTGRLPFPV
jgi:hypothetical protein